MGIPILHNYTVEYLTEMTILVICLDLIWSDQVMEMYKFVLNASDNTVWDCYKEVVYILYAAAIVHEY